MQRYNIFNKHNNVCIIKDGLNKVSFEGKSLIVCDPITIDRIDFPVFLREDCKDDIVIIVKNIDIEEVFERLTSELKFVQAAGGIVENEKGQYLFIFRASHWDLPKGHREKGENLETTALREVMEETGIKKLVLKEKVGITYHVYNMRCTREIKETHWYRMETCSDEKLFPQYDEGIVKVEWHTRQQVERLKKSYFPSLLDLLCRFGFRFD